MLHTVPTPGSEDAAKGFSPVSAITEIKVFQQKPNETSRFVLFLKVTFTILYPNFTKLYLVYTVNTSININIDTQNVAENELR